MHQGCGSLCVYKIGSWLSKGWGPVDYTKQGQTRQRKSILTFSIETTSKHLAYEKAKRLSP